MPTYGFTGSVTDLQFARMMALYGPRVLVETPTAWAPTPTGADRTVSVAAGSGRILGLRHETTGATTVAQAANATGNNRVDLVVWRADFTAKTVTLTAITGSSATVPPAITKTALTTGDKYDFPVCVCVTPNGGGAYSASDIFDIRPYGGSGGLVVPQGTFVVTNPAHDLVPGQRWLTADTGGAYQVNTAGTALTSVGAGELLPVLGGKIVSTAGNIHTGITTTEVNITSLALENKIVYSGEVYVFNVNLEFTFAGTDSTQSYVLRVRKDTALTGTIICQWVIRPADNQNFSATESFSMPWKAPSTDLDADFYFSVVRAAGTGSMNIQGDSKTSAWITRHDTGTWTVV